MICKSCGAKYDKKELNCPYCYSENAALAKKIKKEMLASYDAEAKEMEITVPKQAVQKWTRHLVKILPAIIIIAVVATIGAFVWGRVSADAEYREKQENLENMEALFEAGDWEALDAYYYDHDNIYGAEFAKYNEITQAYSWFEMFLEELESIEDLENITFETEEGRQELYVKWIDLALENAGYALSTCKTFSEDTSFRGNEKELEKMYNECAGILLVFGYSEEEIEQITLGADSERFEALKEKMLAYYLER